MRIRDLLAERVDIDTPAFRQWFRGSRVVDTAGRPLLCYHATTHAFDDFRPMSHFGTLEASQDIIRKLKGWSPDEPWKTGSNIHAVYLRITNPFPYRDLGLDLPVAEQILIQWANDGSLTPALRDQFAITDPQPNRQFLLGKDEARLRPEREARMVRLLEDRGHDGLVYENEMEDEGSVSWVIFRPDQVWPLFRD